MNIFKTGSGLETLHYSAPVVVTGVEFNTDTRTIMAFCADGNTRKCRVDRCASLEFARALYKAVKEFAKHGHELEFCSMGNNSPDKWFCNVDSPKTVVADDLSLAAYLQS
jgi:hypothetical protein